MLLKSLVTGKGVNSGNRCEISLNVPHAYKSINLTGSAVITHDVYIGIGWEYGQRHVNHSPIHYPYKCHENTNHSRVPQLSKAPIPTSKWKYVPNLLQT